MKEDLPDIELIERYFDHDLTPSERSGFQEKLEHDSAFRKLFEREKILIETLRFQAASEDLRFLKEVDRSMEQQRQRGLRLYIYPLAAAACLALFLLVLWPATTPDNGALFASWYTPYPNIFEPTVRGDAEANARARAFQAYEQGEYAAAASLFEQLLAEKREPGVLMLRAHALLMTSRTAEAITLFEELAAGGTPLALEATWYLALSRLKLEEPARAVPLLREVAASKHPLAAKAQAVLEELQ